MHLKNGIVYSITVTEDGCIFTEGKVIVTEEVFLVVEERFVFFVYRLVPDAKPDRGMM